MTSQSRFPNRLLILAGLSGAIAWTVPWLIIDWLPEFPPYRPGSGFVIPLLEMIIGFSLAGVLAAILFLLGIRIFSSKDNVYIPPTISSNIVLAIIAGMFVGGAFTGLIGFGVGFSNPINFFAGLFDFQDNLPEPFLSVGLMSGAALAALIILSFSVTAYLASSETGW